MPLPSKSPRHRKPRKVVFGERQTMTHGLHREFMQDIYHYAMTASWPVFFAAIASIFLVMNVAFAGLFMLGAHPIANLLPDNFLGAFFFSVETLATVGYGDMHPQTVYAHVISTVEIFIGMINLALITGVMFARFSRPRSRILFSNVAVARPLNGQHTLMIRAANARQNVIGEASAKLRLMRNEVTAEGLKIRRVHDLKLQRDQQPVFLLGWTLMHPIDEASALFQQDAASLARDEVSLILTIDGVDETTSQLMRARHVYEHHTIRWQHAFVDILHTDEEGVNHMDYTKFHEVRAL